MYETMSILYRVAGVSLALCLLSRSASANIGLEDAAIADASTVDDEDARASADSGTTGPTADAAAGSDADAPAANVDEAASTGLTIPSASSVQYSAPDSNGGDGCNTTSTSLGALPALGLLAVLGVVRSRRRR